MRRRCQARALLRALPLQFASTPKPSTVIRSATLTVTDLLDKSRATSSNTSRHLLCASRRWPVLVRN